MVPVSSVTKAQQLTPTMMTSLHQLVEHWRIEFSDTWPRVDCSIVLYDILMVLSFSPTQMRVILGNEGYQEMLRQLGDLADDLEPWEE